MIRRIVLFYIVVAMSPIICLGQNKTYLGIEAAVTGDLYKISDNGGNIKKTPFGSGMFGINIKQELTQTWFLETGLIKKYYSDGVNFKTISGTSPNYEFDAWLIPIRLGASLPLKKNKIYLVPVISYNFGINSSYGNGDGTGASESITKANGNKVSCSYTADYNLTKTYSLLQAGVGIDFRLFKTASLSLLSSYYFGLKKINVLDIKYTINNSGPQTAAAYSNGSMTSFGVQLKYPISNFWTKAK